jgi:uncharacterized protein involved in type VI secretion and phage assembly
MPRASRIAIRTKLDSIYAVTADGLTLKLSQTVVEGPASMMDRRVTLRLNPDDVRKILSIVASAESINTAANSGRYDLPAKDSG